MAYINNGESGLSIRNKLNEGLLTPAEVNKSGNVLNITIPEGSKYIYFVAPSDYSTTDTYKINGVSYTLKSQFNKNLSNPWKNGAVVKMFISDGNIAYVDDFDGFTKDETLNSSTSSLFELGIDAVPNDILAYIGKYAQHWWKRIKYQDDQILLGEEKTIYICYSTSSSDSKYWEYSANLDTTNPDSIRLDRPSSTAYRYNDDDQIAYFRGKYFKRYTNWEFNPQPPNQPEDKYAILYADSDAAIDSGRESSGSRCYYLTIQAHEVTFIPAHTTGSWEYLQSNDEGAYPKNQESGGYIYIYLGQPLKNTPNSLKVKVGTYVGTGKYGKDNPNSLSYEFDAALVVIGSESEMYRAYAVSGAPLVQTEDPVSSSSGEMSRFKWKPGGVEWFSSSSSAQLNNSGETYYYVIIGY